MNWKLRERYGLRNSADDDIFDEGGEGEPEVIINNEGEGDDDDYDPAIHDDPENPLFRGRGEDDGEPKPKVSTRAGAPGFGATDVAAAVAAALKTAGVTKPNNEQGGPAFDQAAFRKQIGYREITEADLTALLDPDKPAAERAKLFQELLDAREKSVVTIAQALYQQLGEKLGSFETTFAEQRREQAKAKVLSDVVKAYPALKEVESALPEIFEALRQTGYRPKTPEEGVRMIASFAQQTVRKFNPKFSLKPSQATTRRPMAGSVNMGGTGTPGRQGNKKPFNDIWD